MACAMSFEPIAIIGMSCEFAGGIHTPIDFWQALEESRDLGSEIPVERTDFLSYCAHIINQDDGEFKRKLIRRGYFLPTSALDTFDAGYFNLSDGEAVTIDPCHRLLMMKFVHLIEDAGYTLEQIRGSRTSVHIGQFSNDHALGSLRLKPEHSTRFHGPHILLYNASARLSYHFDLHGPNLSLDSACSTGLQAIHLGVQGLRTGEADMAVCGSVNTFTTPEQMFQYSMFGASATDGRSRAFSIDANGYAKGEGLGLVLLKRLSDAERDGDRIYCVLHDVLSNHDGSEGKNSYVVPAAAGQLRLLKEIYARTQYDRNRIFYVEAHGTGTQVGDPTEANTIGEFFQRSPFDPPLLIGSVKSNIGHTEGTAGIASLIKTIMCMKHRAIPPNMHFKAYNPKIETDRFNLHVVQTMTVFPPINIDDEKEYPVAIGISSFGVGGNNAHAIIEEYHPKERSVNANGHVEEELLQQHGLFIFSTKSSGSLYKQVVSFNEWLQQIEHQDDDRSFLARISQQLLLKRTISHEHLAIFVSANRAQLEQQLDLFLQKQSTPGLLVTKRISLNCPRICFVFSGQGPQWWAMGRELYSSEPVFRQWIQRINEELIKINGGEFNLLNEMIEKTEEESRVNDTNIAQPALFAVQVALAALLVSWHIFPSAIVSHSAGEQAAAFISGRVSLNEAVRIVYNRSRLQHRNTRQGGRMLAVAMNEQEVRDSLLKGIERLISVAGVNSPRSVTLSGNEKIIDELEGILTTLHSTVFKARLRIENAFHSHQMDRFGIREEILSILDDIRGLPLKNTQEMFDIRCAQASLYSPVTGGRIDDKTPLDAHHWWSNIRQYVRFGDAIQAIIQDGVVDAFLELSPHPVLATSIRECYEKMSTIQPIILPTLKRKEDEQKTLLASIAQLSYSPDVWKHYLASRCVQPSQDVEHLFNNFPLYAFNLTPCWYESQESAIERLAYRLPLHPLLGVRQWTQHTSAIWKSLINLNIPEHAYLCQHKIQDAILFPAAGFLEMALAACRQLLPVANNDETPPPIAFEQVEFIKVLVLTEHKLTEVVTQIVMPMREWLIYSRPWSAAGQDCRRSSGMACNDFIDSFVDLQTLNAYSLRQFTLHARGRIDIGPHLNIHASSAYRFSKEETTSWYDLNVPNLYDHLSTRGYQYGPKFRIATSIKTTNSEVTGRVTSTNSEENDVRYYLHPLIIDGCFHTFLSIVPGIETFLPVAINKMIIYGSTCHLSQLVTHGSYHSFLVGLSQERAYALDAAIFNSNDEMIESNTKPVVICEMFKMQRIPGCWTLSDKSIFQKINEIVHLPNGDYDNHVQTILSEFCLQKKWSSLFNHLTKTVDLLPSSNTLMSETERQEIEMMNKDNDNDNDNINNQLANSIEPLNALAGMYALQALQHLASLENIQLIVKDKLCHLVRDDEPHFFLLFEAAFSLVHQHGLIDECGNTTTTVTNHSIQLIHQNLVKQFPRLKSFITLMNAIGSKLGDMLFGGHAHEELFTQNKETELALEDVQNTISFLKTQCVFQALINHMQNTRPNSLRILLFGVSISSVSVPIIRQLADFAEETGTYVKVLYVDLTETLLLEAEQAFQSCLPNNNKRNQRIFVSYRVYDIEAESNNSTLLDESHDIIFVASGLQTTSDINHSLDSLRRLLVPGGLLLVIELTLTHSYFDLIFGLFPYWWRDSHSRAPLTIDQWRQAFQSVGGFEPMVVSAKANAFGDSLMIMRKSTARSILIHLSEWQDQAWLLFADRGHKLSYALVPHLPSSNIEILQDTVTTDHISSTIDIMLKQHKQLHIIFAWPLDVLQLGQNNNETRFESHVEHLCYKFVYILQSIQKYHRQHSSFPYTFILTQNSQPMHGKSEFNPRIAPLIGLIRSLSVECPRHHIKLIDLQPTADIFAESSYSDILMQHMINSREADNLDEVILSLEADRRIRCFQWYYDWLQSKEQQELSSKMERTIVPKNDADKNPFWLQVAPSRFVADLVWMRDPIPINNLLPGQIQVRIHCTSLNFRDVLKVRGLYPHTRVFGQRDCDQPLLDRDTTPGTDFMGTVILSHSMDLKIGDRVIGFCSSGTFHSHIILNTSVVSRVPDECLLSDEQLAALPTAFFTALLSLKHRIRLKHGQTVLIHAATGATGQACIQYCQAVGARVIATAGSDAKRCFLRKHYGIEHVFNSRDLAFVTEIRSLFPNGINVIVNSLSGPLLQESFKLLAPHGHFIELGKRDVYARTSLPIFDLRQDCNLHVIDLTLHVIDEPHTMHEMINDAWDHFRRGLFKPFEPLTIFEPSEIIDAFTQCSLGLSMGKMVVRMTNSEQPLLLKESDMNTSINENSSEGSMFPFVVCESGTILVSGGLGGLGLTMSRWMIEKRGVKHIVLMSRRTIEQFEKTENNPQLEDWLQLKETAVKHNASIDVVQADVTHFDGVYELIKRLNQTSHPVRGIIHSAVISDDKLLTNLSQETLFRVMEPKVRGGWNLHQASQQIGASLHFFIMFSSIRNHLIDPGSSGYNVGNEFFEALAHYRREQLKLPALSIALPAVHGAGMFHRQQAILNNLLIAQGMEMLPTVATFELVERLFSMQTNYSSPIVFAVDWKRLYANKANLANHQLVQFIEQQATQQGISNVPANDSGSSSIANIEVITERIRETVMRLLGASNIDRIDIDRSLLSLGLDSLAAVSLYNWLSQEWGAFITVAEIFQGIKISEIASRVQKNLVERQTTSGKIETTLSSDMEQMDEGEGDLTLSTTKKATSYNGMEGVLRVFQLDVSLSKTVGGTPQEIQQIYK
ncbi:unnamed protein product [Rotaria sp. Silwood1]|nr:unnamed protein product [Rotaria sp. Silwood1]CAF4697097.1 unnamed protein product [Rotaria sp. Silwood1]CAF4783630.1 unnamed protein product [Rotaria sp. Silwood1]